MIALFAGSEFGITKEQKIRIRSRMQSLNLNTSNVFPRLISLVTRNGGDHVAGDDVPQPDGALDGGRGHKDIFALHIPAHCNRRHWPCVDQPKEFRPN